MPDTDIVNTQDDAPLSEADVNVGARLENFKQILSNIATICIQATQVMSAIKGDIQDLNYAASSLLAQFRDEALQMYPDIEGQDIEQVMSGLAASHPLMQLWSQYQVKLDEISQTLAVKSQDYSANEAVYNQAEADQASTLQMYAQFQSDFPDLPTADALQAQVDNEKILMTAEEGSTVASLPAIELVNPLAASIVMKQAADVQAEDVSSSDPDDGADGEYTPTAVNPGDDGQIYTMMNRSVDPGITSQSQIPSQYKPLGIALGVLALAYILFGGSKKESA